MIGPGMFKEVIEMNWRIGLICFLSLIAFAMTGVNLEAKSEAIIIAQEEIEFGGSGSGSPEPEDQLERDNATAPMDSTLAKLLAGITWFGHASIMIQDLMTIYIDPFQLPDGAPKADLILITHDHYDHFSEEDISKILKPETQIVSIQKVTDSLKQKVKNLRTVKPGDTLTIANLRIEATPSYNIDKQYHPKEKGYVGYLIRTSTRSFYHAGDTDLIPEMQNIRADVAFLPVGGKYTMNALQAANAAKQIKPKVAVPIHYGSIVGSQSDAESFEAILKADKKITPFVMKPTKSFSVKKK